MAFSMRYYFLHEYYLFRHISFRDGKQLIMKAFWFFFKILFICQKESEHKQGELQVEGEAGSPPSKEPDAGLYPRTLGS